MSARLALALLASAAALSSCSHSRKAERPAPPPAAGASASATSGGVPPRDGKPRVPASAQALLSDNAVEQIQRALEERHLLDGQHERGHLDEPTSAAIQRFQKGEALAATGFPDRETLQRLGIDPESAYGKPVEKPR